MPRSGGRSTTERCSFCDKGKLEVEKLIQGGRPGIYICNTCVEICHSIIDENNAPESAPPLFIEEIPTPRRIVGELDEYIIAQDRAKKVLSVAVHNHYKRLILEDEGTAEARVEKSNMLLVGPTGCGKTALARAMATLLDVPFAIGDATTLTEAGYVGEDVENLILKLVQNADYNIERAEQGIIFVDEIDKVGRATANVSITRDVSGEGVQQSLLKLLEGTVANVPPQGGRKHPEQQYLQVDTTNILFICGGTFTGLEDIIANRVGRKQIGFNPTWDSHAAENIEARKKIMKALQVEDLVQFGMIPELLGRLPVITTLSPLDEGDLVRVLQEPRDALVKQYAELFRLNGTKLRFTAKALRDLAALAIHRGTGARGLRSILEEVMLDILYELPEHKDELLEFLINSDAVRHRTFAKGKKVFRKKNKGKEAGKRESA
ncbi:MAG: ATP-dependent Clp protease ATP-binding subunit ClpX [Planctomycetota bacterium]|nr:ATP-dependent Clp protease ATP-binding subunit ClpX [Planctomycetota bacterium]